MGTVWENPAVTNLWKNCLWFSFGFQLLASCSYHFYVGLLVMASQKKKKKKKKSTTIIIFWDLPAYGGVFLLSFSADHLQVPLSCPLYREDFMLTFFQRGCGISPLDIFPKPLGHCPELPALSAPTWADGFRGLCQPQPSWSSVILYIQLGGKDNTANNSGPFYLSMFSRPSVFSPGGKVSSICWGSPWERMGPLWKQGSGVMYCR